jgi:ankyrin repeat protein
MIRKLTARSSLDSLRKEAKRWLAALRSADPNAIARLKQILPGAGPTPGLREVQQALAREHGFESWAALKLQLADEALARRTHAERLAEFLEHAILNYGIPPGEPRWQPTYPDDPSRRQYAARILSKHQEIAQGSIHAAVLVGDLDEVKRLLKQDARLASSKDNQRRWEPLLYLAFGRLPLATASENALAIATLLLDHGANPKVQMSDGHNSFTAVTGVIGFGERSPLAVPPHPRAEELVRLLIERGAEPFDIQALYNTSLWHDDTEWLDLLHGYDERSGNTARWTEPRDGHPGQLDYLLGNAVDRNHVRRAEWLLAHGADPRSKHAYTKRNLRTIALLHGHAPMAELLEKAGSPVEELEGLEAFQAACLRLDLETAGRLARQHPEYVRDASTLLAAARTGRDDAIKLLLDLGTPVNAAGASGERALHVAVWSDSVPTAQLLAECGADVDARDSKFDSTPLGWAIHLGKPQLIEYFGTVSSDVLGLVRAGKVDRLRSLFDAQPSLAKTGRGAETLLFCLPGADEDLAMETAELLLSWGANPSLKNSAGRTAADEAERNGMDALAELLRVAETEGFPSSA